MMRQGRTGGEQPMCNMALVAIVYLFLIVLVRLSGQRQVGQLAPFDFGLASGVGQRCSGYDEWRRPLGDRHRAIGYATFRSKRFENS